MRIKSRRNDDQIGAEIRRHLLKRRFKRSLVVRSRCCRAQWKIQRVSQTASGSLLSTRTCARIPRILVSREKVDRRIVVKDSLRAVAVMNVPIDDRDLVDLRILL